MTLNQFRDKYGVEYSVVYNATFMVKSDDHKRRDREYDEAALKTAVTEIIEARIKRLRNDLDRHEKILARLTEI